MQRTVTVKGTRTLHDFERGRVSCRKTTLDVIGGKRKISWFEMGKYMPKHYSIKNSVVAAAPSEDDANGRPEK